MRKSCGSSWYHRRRKMAEKKRHTGRVLMAGSGYSKKKKDHYCKIEVLRTV